MTMPWDPLRELEIQFSAKDRVRASRAVCQALDVPEDSRFMLGHVGLPRACLGFVTMHLLGSAISEGLLESLCSKPGILSRAGRLREIGREEGQPICICSDGSGYIVIVEEMNSRLRFINSSPAMYGGFIARYVRYTLGLDDGFYDSFQEIAREADPLAFEDPDNYWPVIFEQIRDGLL